VEFCDWDITWYSPDGSLKEDSAMYKMNREFIKAVYDTGGADPCPGPKLEKWVSDAGFEEIKVWKYPSPFGTWPADKRMKEIGAWNYLQVSEGLEGLIYYVFTKILNLSKDEVDVAAARFRSELRNPRIHPLCHLYIIIGKKPESKSTDAEAEGTA
jgi:hypothetical protein